MGQEINIDELESSLTEEDLNELKNVSKKYDEKLRKAYIQSKKREYELAIKEINRMNRNSKKVTDSLTTSKFFMLFILMNCTVIEIYSMVTMFVFNDLSSLSSLIVAVVTESISYAVYSAKAYKGKKSEVEAELERDRFEFEKENALQEIESFEEGDYEGSPEVALGGKRFRKVR